MALLLLLRMIGVDAERTDEDGVALLFPEYMDLRLSGCGRSGVSMFLVKVRGSTYCSVDTL
jgi:hypothetical protein